MLYLSCSCIHICKRSFHKRKAKIQRSLKKVCSTIVFNFLGWLKDKATYLWRIREYLSFLIGNRNFPELSVERSGLCGEGGEKGF